MLPRIILLHTSPKLEAVSLTKANVDLLYPQVTLHAVSCALEVGVEYIIL